MTRTRRAITALLLLALLTACPSRITQAQSGASQEDSGKMLTIMGSVGLAGVNMKGLPGNPITDENGIYSARVESGWSGVVTPEKEGYHFDPKSRSYNQVAKDLKDDNYIARVLTFTLSGNVGAADVLLAGLPGEPFSAQDGSYAVALPYGWTGIIEPRKDGYSFTPTHRAIERLTQNRSGIDFTSRARMMTITDKIEIQFELGKPPESILGVRITAEPGGYTAVTDARGRYAIQVPYGWTGHLFLTKEGFEFSPVPYDNVTEDIDLVHSGRAAEPPVVAATVTLPDSTTDVLVIPTTEVAPEAFVQVVEDMRVMLHILRDRLNEPRMISGVLYDFGDFFSNSGRNFNALYIQGYGALFMMKVDFPLSVPPQGQGQDAQAGQPAVDPVWQRARDRLYAPPGATPWWSQRASGEADVKSFEQLKQDLIDSLRHAANIRNIEPNEWVIVTVTGRGDMAPGGGFGGGMGGMGGGMMGGPYGGTGGGMAGGYGGMMGGVSGYGGGGGSFGGSAGGSFHVEARSQSGGSTGRRLVQPVQPPASTTVLTIQAKKADIDALADGQTDLEQFREKVKVFTY